MWSGLNLWQWRLYGPGKVVQCLTVLKCLNYHNLHIQSLKQLHLDCKFTFGQMFNVHCTVFF